MGTSAPRILILTNMWPEPGAPTRGGFVAEQVEDVRRLLPDWEFEVMVIDGRRGRRAYLEAIFELRRRLREGHDLIHAHYGLSGAVAAFQRSTPYVVTYHGSDVYIPWQRRLSRWAGRGAATTIFVSERLRAKYGSGNGAVIPCGVDTDQFAPGDRSAARRQLGIPEEAVVVVFPGDPARVVKGYPLFRSTLDALPEDARRRIREVRLTGLTHDEVPVRLQAADAVLMTSRYEGAGTVAKEAIACGVPVVATDVGDVRMVIGGAPGCAVVESEPESLAAALLEAVGSRPAWDGRSRLEGLGVDRPAVARRVADVYRAALAAKGERTSAG